ncbi:MAG TPA: serine/threonine-protein kinase [Kofleriaceae bacterium]|jgi:serine/threonine-protein kinase
MTAAGSALTLSSRLGSYELIRPIGQGGMADIYLARRMGPGGFERHVAVKVLGRSRAADPEACAMFLDEARLVALLNHQNIASVLEVDVVDGKHYLAMEYVHGADLREVLAAAQRAGKLLPHEAALAIVCAAAAGLDHAHRRCGPDGKPLKLVHRDVSLSNIMVGHDGAVKVVDFGIATTTIASVHTSPGVVRGKASYMSPEQCLGDRVDQRSDVFALGVVLYELTTGVRCFHGKTDFDRMLAVVRGDYLPPSELAAGYPRDLEQVIRTALAIAPGQRFASAAALIEALERVAIAHGWVGGPGAIQRAMLGLFGDVAEPWTSYADDVPVTEPHSIVSLPLVAEPTRPARRLARGTASECLDDVEGIDGGDDLDERTRGRGPLRRSRPWLAA